MTTDELQFYYFSVLHKLEGGSVQSGGLNPRLGLSSDSTALTAFVIRKVKNTWFYKEKDLGSWSSHWGKVASPQGWLLVQGLGDWGALASLLAPLWHPLKATELSRRFGHGCQHTWPTPGSACD